MKKNNLKKAFWLGISLLVYLPAPAIYAFNTVSGYVANNEGVKGVFDALSSTMSKPVILSKEAARKKITGEFDLSDSQQALQAITRQLGLIWYMDGQAYYIYDASEMRSSIVVLKNTSFEVVKNFLIKSGLYDARYPVRADSKSATFYVSGPPIYVELVLKTAHNLDVKSDGYDGRENIAVIPLNNTFVDDRVYQYRNETITIPGLSTVVNQVINGKSRRGTVQPAPAVAQEGTAPTMPDFPQTLDSAKPDRAPQTQTVSNGMSIIGDPGSNSLLVRGSAEQVAYVRDLVAALDKPRRHIELSVWIVDFRKEAFDNLGVQWTGSLNAGNLGLSLNGGTSTIDGASFMVTALALSEKNQANIVSRPMILTQENIPAIFDNNRTFYARLIGERTAQLQNITYGTSISVIPRFTDNQEIEMMLNVEDGNQSETTRTAEADLPEVGRTNISTIARVPRGKSLLIGGYTRDEESKVEGKIPGLGDLPWVGGLFRYQRDRTNNLVRVFLIQPREIDAPLNPDANELISDMKKDLSSGEVQNWMQNYLDSQKWQ
ncbi:type III secretion system outer membrane ring subunit SctC [Kalamiella sp. sgz302252]|uniref:type III secretion system outer membrane ring subunit SctC n=1 Tax=Pantoea sp. sgz302252 TaxID=3341827 RepID=UPI0036D2FCD4